MRLPAPRRPPRRATLPALAAAALAVVVLLLSGCSTGGGDGQTVRVYSGRHYDLERAFEQFTADTGIKVEFLFGNDAELRERLAAEGEDTPADVYITVDAGNLVKAADQGLFRPIDSPVLDQAIPPAVRDPEDRWFGLALRARSIVYHPDRVQPSEVTSYADLADPRWKGRLCLRNSSGGYQQSLVASLIADNGTDEARRIVEGWLANAEIMENDVMILDAVAAGRCDVGITNHYYLARKYEDDPGFPVKMAWADQQGDGVHVNISGGGVTTHADRAELGQRLLEWMATTGQNAFIAGNHELPANPTVAADDLLQATFTLDFLRNPMSAQTFGARNAEAVALMDEVGYR